ncbi:MAG TPA: hypothetical protein EYQ64_11895 [Gemmatimonadetes bacterium]|nr:hypothetical protein [Gemmatimonadota bacterium]
MSSPRNATLTILFLLVATPAFSQAPAPATPPVATDVTNADIQAFIDALPRDRISDRPIRTVEVTGDYRVGVYGVFRPMAVPGGAILHRANTTEIYYMRKGAGTLVTGGRLVDANEAGTRGSTIEGGVERRIVPGDVVVIPGHTPHWWKELETDIEYMIFRPDPDNRLQLR